MSIRGLSGNPTENQINSNEWKEDGPFELSPERGRYALMYSIAENNSVHFSLPLARFTTPDVGYRDGQYVSLFAPLLSYLIIPGYLLGKLWSIGQVGAYAVVSLFALLNVVLIYAIARELKANRIASALGGIAFLFATPAFTYAVNLYQHHISTFLILLSTLLLLRSKNFFTLAGVFCLCALSLPLDYPNLFLMLPIGLYALSKIIFIKKDTRALSFNYVKIFSLVAMVFPVLFFLWFNIQSYGGPFNFLGGSSISVAKAIDEKGLPSKSVSSKDVDKAPGSVSSESGLSLFNSRNLLNGFYIHTISPDRGIIFYAPVILFGVAGAALLFRRKHVILPMLLGVMGMNILLYSLWSDPYGGWAFGSRYLIPTYAICGIFIAYGLSVLRRYSFFMSFFFVFLSYSIAINTVGALTSSRNPPQVQVLNLEKETGQEQKYTFDRNFDYLVYQGSKSYVWQTYGKEYVSATNYYWIITLLLIVLSGGLVTREILRKESTQ